MVQKTFVVDTSVLLQDPLALTRFGENDVVLPIIVLEILDRLKRNSDELGNNARAVLRYIDSLRKDATAELVEKIRLPEGPTLRILLMPRSSANDFPFSLEQDRHKILSIAYDLKQANENVVFVSKDLITRWKALLLNIPAEDYLHQKVSYDQMQKGIRKVELSKHQIDLFFKDGRLHVPHEEFSPNEYLHMHCKEGSSSVGRYDFAKKAIEPLQRFEKGVWGIAPLNIEQKCVFDLLLRDDIPLVTLLGPAGTGKTLLALACGLSKVFDASVYSKILVSRPIVPLGKDIGYLPGTKEEKLFHWMQPIYDNLETLCAKSGREDKENSLFTSIMESNKLITEAVTYIRGRTLPKMYMIIDEAQNLTPHEIKTIISRAGKGSKMILTGDPTQIDNPYLDRDSNGLTFVHSRFRNHPLYGHVFLDKTERSELAAVAAEIL